MTEIAYIGLGIMGRGMVRNLLAAGHAVTAWNRSTVQLPAEMASVNVAGSVSEAVAGRERIWLCLTGPDAQRAVYYGQGLVDALKPGAIVMDSTTTDPLLASELCTAVAARGAAYVDCPVFGSRNEAWGGELDIVCGADAATFTAVEPLLKTVSKSLHRIGPVGSGAAMKLVGNLLVAAQVQSVGEALSLARKAGLDMNAVLGVLKVTDYASGVVVGTASASARGDYSPNFYLKHMLKDARLIAAYAQALDVPIPSAAATQQMFQAAVNQGLGDLNASAVHKLMFRLSGLED